MNATVSVIVPTYRRAALLPTAVRSVLAQTYRPLELVVVNDGSPDDTPAVLESLRDQVQTAGVVPVFLHQANAGVAAARNTGLGAATGDWVAFLDDDDTWDPRKLELQLAALAATGADLCCCQVFQPDSHGGRNVPVQVDELLNGKCAGAFLARTRNAHICSIVVRRAIAPKFAAGFKVAEDLLWVYTALQAAHCCSVPQSLVRMGDQPGSLMRTPGLERLVELDAHVERWLMQAREVGANGDQWDEAGWKRRVAADFSQFVKHRLYVGDRRGAREVFERGMALSGGAEPLSRLKSKLRKAWWLGLIGKRLKHPKSA